MTSSSSLIDEGVISSNKPSELSAIGVGCSTDNKNGDDKPTSTTISTLTANSADITSMTIDADTNNTIYRAHAVLGHVRTVKSRLKNILCKNIIVAGKSQEKNLTNNTSSKKESIEDVEKGGEEDKRRILEENPHIPEDTLESYLRIPIE
jgi:hypothetical protein